MSKSIALGLLMAAAFASPALGQVITKDRPMPGTLHVYQPGIDVLHYDFQIGLVRGDTIDGRAVIHARRAAGADTLRLDLLLRMKVDSVAVNGAPVTFGRDERTIRVPIGSARDSFAVAVVYRGVPADGLIIRRDSLGRRTVFGDNWPNRARNWLPTVDHPSDKATVSWRITSHAGDVTVANGARTTDGWMERRPIPTYLMVIAAAPMVETPLGDTACGLAELAECVPQSVYTSPELKDYAPGPFARAPAMVEFYSRLIGPFPYEKLAHLQSSTRFGGMENASAIFYSDAAFRRRAVRLGLIAHETVHQWLGNSVTPRDWPHLWLSEGFATYFEQVWHEHDLGRDSLRAGMTRIRAQIIAAKEVSARPVLDTAQTDLMALLNNNSYQKGGFVLHMLRALVGDSAFFGGVRNYYAKYRHGTAVTDEFRNEMETASGRDLRWFFDQWLRRPGFATVATSWRHDAPKRALEITVDQSGAHGHYRFPLTVEIDDGTTVRRAVIDVPARSSARLTLPLEIERAPRRVTIDPDVQVLAVFSTR